MKIAMIGHKRIPSREGGIEIVVTELSRRLSLMGNKVVAYNRKGHHISGKNYDGKETESLNDVKTIDVFTFQNKKLNAMVYSLFATIMATAKRYNIIHYHAEGPAAMIFIPHLFGIKTVVTIHGLDWQRAKWGGFATKYLLFGEKMAAKYADEVIVLSENVKKYFKEKYNRETVFIPNGISKPELCDDNIINQKFGIKKDEYILYLGRLVPEKGVHFLINAYNQLNTSKKLVIAGGSSHSNEYVEVLKELSKNNSNIIFTDFVEGKTLDSLYSNAYIYCLPSELEGMPISLLEAMSYGNCCVHSDIEECTEVTEKNAISFKCSSQDSLAEKLDYLINNPDIVNQYKSNSASFILNKYSWDDMAIKTENLYKQVLNK